MEKNIFMPQILCRMLSIIADTGTQHLSELATALFNKLVSYTGGQSKQVQEVRVVLPDRNMITVFINTMQTLEEKHKKSNKGGLLNWIKGECVIILTGLQVSV